jgi:SAM-dependent methyltransferase
MFEWIKSVLKNIPLIGPIARRMKSLLVNMLERAWFLGSQGYWESRYASGGKSGIGSYGKLAEFKADIVNSFVRDHSICSVIEFGCGGGNQLSLVSYPGYIGLDVSKTALKLCKDCFEHDETKRFVLYQPDIFFNTHRGGLALSLDVIYHLVENRVFELYMAHLFSSAEKFVIICSSDTDVNHFNQAPHINHRNFSEWVKANRPEWRLLRRIPNKYPLRADDQAGSFAEFFVYEKYI